MTDGKTESVGPRCAIIGFGNIAELGHLPALLELGVDVVAAVDICEERRKKAGNAGLEAFENLSSLDNLDLDFIDVCTPPSYRYLPIEYAARRGLDVVCEKPVATPGEHSALKKLMHDSSIFFYPIHNWKHAPQYVKAKEIVMENGGAENLTMNTLRTHYGTGNPDWNPNWRVDRSISGGGIIMDHGYHNIYLAMHLFGSDFTKAVLEEITYFKSNPEIEKRASFTLNFPGERRAKITLDWGAGRREIKNTIYECNHKLELSDKRIVNSNHTYEFDESLSGDSVHGAWFKNVFADFLRLRASKDKRHFQEAIRVLEGINSLYEQARS
ncbi:MAG TPA: Gfo/Idh/MocA family oxidoreductase [Euryarchaeota archaeon]|nr:Gfo/Idh/MocA family oxidoreductase [Euryarchaeota archaeon]